MYDRLWSTIWRGVLRAFNDPGIAYEFHPLPTPGYPRGGLVTFPGANRLPTAEQLARIRALLGR
jgi:hypothetical protein